MAQSALNVREFQLSNLSNLFGFMELRKWSDPRKNSRTGEEYCVVSVLNDMTDEMFEVRLMGRFPDDGFKKGDMVDFTNVTYTLRANGRSFGNSIGGELVETFICQDIVQANSGKDVTKNPTNKPVDEPKK